MAGKTKIDGTDYTIKGGKTKIDGTNYTIKGGKTKIDGTNYSISFGKPLTISGTYKSGNTYYSYVELNGTILNDGSYQFSDTDEIKVTVRGLQSSYNTSCVIYRNGVVIRPTAGTTKLDKIPEYNSMTIVFTSYSYNSYVQCEITTT